MSGPTQFLVQVALSNAQHVRVYMLALGKYQESIN